jgi:Secretion system C-terminal sorting domain
MLTFNISTRKQRASNAQATRKVFCSIVKPLRFLIMAIWLYCGTANLQGQSAFCVLDNPCNLVPNGSFECGMNPCDLSFPEQTINGIKLPQHFSHPNAATILPNVANGWASSNTGSPDCIINNTNPNPCNYVPLTGATGTARTGNRHIRLFGINSTTRNYSEGVFTNLTRPLIAGQQYEVSFWVLNTSSINTIPLRVGISSGSTASIGVTPYSSAVNVNFNVNLANNGANFTVTGASVGGNNNNNRHLLIPVSNSWQNITIRFTCPNNILAAPHYLVFETLISNLFNLQTLNILLDDVQLISLNAPALTISKTVNGQRQTLNTNIGDIVSYAISVTSDCQTRFVNIQDVVPAGLQFISATGLTSTTTTATNGVVTTSLSTNIPLPAYQTFVLNYSAQVVGTNVGNPCNGNVVIPNTATAITVLNNSVVSVSSTVSIRVNKANTNSCDAPNITLSFNDAIGLGLLASSTSPAYNTAQNIVVNGTWILNGSYSFATGSRITMKAGAQIVVSPGSFLELNNTTVEGCNDCMWYRILVAKQGQLNVRNSIIKDAQYAVQMENSSTNLVNISNTTFNNNFIGLYMAAAGGALSQISPLNSTSFANNTFVSNNLKRPFQPINATPLLSNSQLPVSNSKGMSAVYFSDVNTFVMGGVGITNTFRDLMSGIVLIRVPQVSIDGASFRNMQPESNYNTTIDWQGTALYTQGNFFSANLYSLKAGLLSPNRLTNCNNGIVGRSLNLDIRNNQMRGITQTGIRARLNTNCQISMTNNSITAAAFGIDMQFMSANNTFIANNNIEINSPILSGTTAGIFYADNSRELPLNITNNTITCSSIYSQVGIHVQGNRKGSISSNYINLNGVGNPNLFSYRVGVAALNTTLTMRCNRVNPVSSALNDNRIIAGTTSFLANGSQNSNDISCNTMDNTYSGILIEGGGQAQIRGNYIKNHMNGLWYANTATGVGQQSNAGNLFISNNLPVGAYEGRNDMSAALLPLTIIRYDSTAANVADLLANPTIVSTNINFLWFQSNSGLVSEYSCNAIPICTPLLQRVANPNINNVDMLVASGTYTAISNWDLHSNKRGLYKKIKQDASISQTMPIMQQFENTEQNSPVGMFDLVTKQTENAITLSFLDSLQVATCQQQIQQIADSIHWADSLVALGQNYQVMLDSLNSRMANLLERCNLQMNILQNTQNSTINNTALVTNAAINSQLDHETAEKIVNEIYLNTLAKGLSEFDVNQIQLLQLVSAQCPDVAGIVVYQARAMYKLVAQVDILDKSTCFNNANNLELQTSSEQLANTNGVLLYPNPAHTEINLQLIKPLAINAKITIYNSLGQLMQTQIVSNETNKLLINVQHLPNGLYTLQVSSEINPIVKSFVIIR